MVRSIRSQGIVDIIETEITAICHDAGMGCADIDDFIARLEGGGPARQLSPPVLETLCNLAQLRREVLLRAE